MVWRYGVFVNRLHRLSDPPATRKDVSAEHWPQAVRDLQPPRRGHLGEENAILVGRRPLATVIA